MTSSSAQFAVFGFAGTHDALRAESVLLEATVDVALIPTPKALGSLCGFALRVPMAQRQTALAKLLEAEIVPAEETAMADRVSGGPS